MITFENKTVLITGASSGIGKSCALAFAKEKANLILLARRKERLDKLSEEIRRKYQSNVKILQGNIQDQKDIEIKLSEILNEYQIDILINNAGLARGLEPIQDATLKNWEEMIDTNVKGLLYVTRQILPQMIKRNNGHIINIGSIAGHEVYPGGGVYSATKHAVNAITQGIRIDVLGTGIRVSTVDPGMVETEFSIVRFDGDKDRADKVYRGLTPLTPDDIAEAVLWVANRPKHVSIHEVIIMPTDQATATRVNRKI